MYDVVLVPCPNCGEKSDFQSKGGECRLRVYELEDAPRDVLSDVNRHAPNQCSTCGIFFEVERVDPSETPYAVEVFRP